MSVQSAAPLLLVGCGKMGSALLEGWLEHGLSPEQVTIVEPNPQFIQHFLKRGCLHYTNTAELDTSSYTPATVVMAVKPQIMDQAVKGVSWISSACVISIAAGKTIRYFEEICGENTAIIRVMPNTPSAIGQGMSVLFANAACSSEQKKTAEGLLSAVGQTAWIDEEDLMNAVTAVSGGGPAYVFLLIETLTNAGVEAGLPDDLSAQLALTTVAGSGALALQSGEDPAILRQNVTSPAGTTLEALNVLMAKPGLQELMTSAIQAATDRSRELA